MPRSGRFALLLLTGWTLGGFVPPAAAGEHANPAGIADSTPAQAERRLLENYPGVRLLHDGDRARKVFGAACSTGESALESAETFRREYAGLFGVRSADLSAGEEYGPVPAVQPLIYLPESGKYKFSLVAYAQRHDGLPVFDADLRLLVRDEPGYPLVLANSALRDLRGFAVDATLRERIGQGAFLSERTRAARDLARSLHPGLSNFREAEVGIWAGTAHAPVEPRVALRFDADSFGGGGPEASRRLVTDLSSGELLYDEDRIIVGVVEGNVSGMATGGDGSDECEPEVVTALPHLRLTSGTGSAFSDPNGDFSIQDGGATVDATLDGRWFDVSNAQGAELSESEPSSFDILFNAENSDEQARAQVNAFVEANRVRDFVALYNPDYPTFTDENIPVRVNRTDVYCPGNAWYSSGDGGSPTGYSINFCLSGSSNPNTAYSSVVHHEFGHHLVSAAGSGQGMYGEGMGDVMSLLINDSPLIGRGFFGSCGGSLRNADNEFRYPCSGSSHYCANLLSGCVWSTREKLAYTNPANYRDILAALAVNAMLLHTGTVTNPDITVDYLTLDDDDPDLANGSPHYDEIQAGFGAHNMAGPARLNGLDVNPKAGFASSGPAQGPFAPDSIVYTLKNTEAEQLSYSVVADAAWIGASNASGVLDPFASTSVVVFIDPVAAAALPAGVYSGTVSFANETAHVGDRAQAVQLSVDRLSYQAAGLPAGIAKLATVTSTIDVAEDFCVGDVNAAVEIDFGSLSDLAVELESPQGIVVRLHDRSPGSGLFRTYDEPGGSAPDGPGSLADFNRGGSAGTWTLRAISHSATTGGWLNGWSLDFAQLGSTCPPLAHDVAMTVPGTARTTIALDAESAAEGPLHYVIASLPSAGELFEPDGEPIDQLPHTLAAAGNLVDYVPANGYLGPDGFGYTAVDTQESNRADVSIQVGSRQLIAAFDLDTDPGWTTTGGWAFGQAAGGGSGNGDPSAGFTGANVYGYNLGGDYGNELGAEFLTSAAIDCSDSVDVQVSFRRWLGVEASRFDRAAFQASNDGSQFVTIWEHDGDTLDESSWSLQTYDLAAVADGRPTVFLRWVMGGTDPTETFAGWNLDDVELTGIEPPQRSALTVDQAELRWTPVGGATSYDLVRGDLAALRATAGDFTQATEACVADDLGALVVPFADPPAPGQGAWFLVRGVSAGAALSYETHDGSQEGLRDEEIAAAALACP